MQEMEGNWMITLKEYAVSRDISYEAVRRQVNKLREELGEHIIVQNKTQMLDDVAVELLDQKRAESKIVVLKETSAEVDQLRDENNNLRDKILQLQEQLIIAQQQVADLQQQQIDTLQQLAAKEKKPFFRRLIG
jgi:tRNA U34 5-carboxymethylaminomethyl modifying GTPase MnmE/TrmE